MINKLNELSETRRLYLRGENIINYLNSRNQSERNDVSDIMISYDLQAGSYIAHYRQFKSSRDAVFEKIVDVLEQLGPFQSMLEAGVGEAVTLGNLLGQMASPPTEVYGFDLSWSRIKYGRRYLQELGIQDAQLFTGDLFQAPMGDRSVDVVYTVHAIESNGGREREALQELYRIAKRYVVLFEPAYELAAETARRRMQQFGYVTGLLKAARELGYEVEQYRLLGESLNPLNPTGVMVIRKEESAKDEGEGSQQPASVLRCPITGKLIRVEADACYSDESLLAYPIIGGIPCLLPGNAIVATHFNDFK